MGIGDAVGKPTSAGSDGSVGFGHVITRVPFSMKAARSVRCNRQDESVYPSRFDNTPNRVRYIPKGLASLRNVVASGATEI